MGKEGIPNSIIKETESYLFMTRFLNKPLRQGSDRVCTIPATLKGKRLIAVVVDKGNKRLAFNQGIRGVCTNPDRSTFTILLSKENGNPGYATFNRAANQCYLVWLPDTAAHPEH